MSNQKSKAVSQNFAKIKSKIYFLGQKKNGPNHNFFTN